MGRRSKYPEEFRQRAAQLVLDSRRSVRDVAGELGVNETLRHWVAAERRQRAEGPAALSADERFELARLRRKVAELELEREILKKAAVDSTCQCNTSRSARRWGSGEVGSAGNVGSAGGAAVVDVGFGQGLQ